MSEKNKNPSFGKGFIYILSNPSMQNLYKVGLTTNSIKKRIQELNSTGVPKSFELVKKYEIAESKLLAVERRSHQKLKLNELHHGKEFFEGSIELIKDAVEDSIFELTGETATDLVGLAYQRKIANDKRLQDEREFDRVVQERLTYENKRIDEKRAEHIRRSKTELKDNTPFDDKYIWYPLGCLMVAGIGIVIMSMGPVGWIFVGIAGWWIYNDIIVKPEKELSDEANRKFLYKNKDEIANLIKSENSIKKKNSFSPKESNQYESDKLNKNIRPTPNNLLKNNSKFWYLFNNKIWHKKLNESYMFDEAENASNIYAYKLNQKDLCFTVNKKNIDYIKYEGGAAVVHCPECNQKCRVPLKPVLDITCPKCKVQWRQNLAVDSYGTKNIQELISSRVASEFENKSLRDGSLWFECYRHTKNLNKRDLIYKSIREEYLINKIKLTNNIFTLQIFEDAVRAIPNMPIAEIVVVVKKHFP